MLTGRGPLCDVCGEYILLDENIEWFYRFGIQDLMCIHLECKAVLCAIEAAGDWRLFPEKGALWKVFKDQHDVDEERKRTRYVPRYPSNQHP